MTDSGWGAALRAARQARGMSLRGLQALVTYDFTYLGQVERGEKPGSRALAERCDVVLDTQGRLAAAFDAAQAAQAEPARSADGAPSAPSAPSTPSGPAAGQVRRPGAVLPGAGPEDCSGACAAAAAGRICVAGSDGCRILPGPGGYGRLLAENRHDLSRPRTGREHGRLLGVRADLALLAGRAALFEQRDPVRARGYLTMARETAGEIGSDARAATVTAHLAVVAASEDRADVAAGYLETARRHAARTGLPLLGTWLSMLRPESVRGVGARAAAALADVGTALERPCTARQVAAADDACPPSVRPTGR